MDAQANPTHHCHQSDMASHIRGQRDHGCMKVHLKCRHEDGLSEGLQVHMCVISTCLVEISRVTVVVAKRCQKMEILGRICPLGPPVSKRGAPRFDLTICEIVPDNVGGFGQVRTPYVIHVVWGCCRCMCMCRCRCSSKSTVDVLL